MKKATTSNITIGSMQKPPEAPKHERHATEFLRWNGTVCKSNSDCFGGPAGSMPKAFSLKSHTALDLRIGVLFADVRNNKIFWVHVVSQECFRRV